MKLIVAECSAAAAAKSLQTWPSLWVPIDGNPPGSAIPGIPQARTLKWIAISFSNAWKWKVKVKSLSHVWLLATPRTAAHQAPRSMGLSRQEYWSGVPLPSLCWTFIFPLNTFIHSSYSHNFLIKREKDKDIQLCLFLYIFGGISKYSENFSYSLKDLWGQNWY